ncbi:hypothetical protein AAMO2058_000933500 [Amorphochlora amoebiformis]
MRHRHSKKSREDHLNFRDIGVALQKHPKQPKTPLSPGVFFRSAHLDHHSVTREDISSPASIFNFRMKKDLNMNLAPYNYHFPLENTDDVYDLARPKVFRWIYQVLGVIAHRDTKFPLLVHCKSGKDRTGVVVAATLFVLGYNKEQILEEYLLTPRADASKLIPTLALLEKMEFKQSLTEGLVRNLSSDANTKKDNMTLTTMDDTKKALAISYLDQKSAAALDVDLMSKHGFKLEQLMELAGLSVACSVEEKYGEFSKNVLIICGPGNNGGDGLVAARHLWHFGFRPRVVYPKDPPKTDFFEKLITQLKDLGITVSSDLPKSPQGLGPYPLILDAMFGFSFKGTPRAPYGGIIAEINKSKATLISVDIPSGWDVEKGDVSGQGLRQPDMLVSLTAPKLAAKKFTGKHHMLGGRFVPPAIQTKYNLVLPSYPRGRQCVEIPVLGSRSGAKL